MHFQELIQKPQQSLCSFLHMLFDYDFYIFFSNLEFQCLKQAMVQFLLCLFRHIKIYFHQWSPLLSVLSNLTDAQNVSNLGFCGRENCPKSYALYGFGTFDQYLYNEYNKYISFTLNAVNRIMEIDYIRTTLPIFVEILIIVKR